MLRSAAAVMAKDARLVLARGAHVAQPILLGLLLVFGFSLSAPPGERFSPQDAMALFWLASVFASILQSSTLFRLEEENGVLTALLLAPIAPQSFWLAKAVVGLVLLGGCQLVFFPAAAVFLGVAMGNWEMVPLILAVDVGLCLVGALLGALSQGARDTLLTVIVFPLQMPLILAGIRGGAMVLAGEAGVGQWLGLALAFDAVFLGVALILFPFVLRGR
ncbi:cytochrome C biogenesis protein CcmB [Thermodesulfomicrobium sp. WS]|uniref:heme exporter protein CcmB n=1 Tax=Thermodesulfomicrobium sp. WS TaxID=3004129 RepID=UPI002490CA59|nr:heme exporter protein CcmB [Thermodesulfomicrobium sp. WS]BDV00982.1 cytochrome C biogenesis protein CcmB [Thermodesulfomicrobium sp. WS]